MRAVIPANSKIKMNSYVLHSFLKYVQLKSK